MILYYWPPPRGLPQAAIQVGETLWLPGRSQVTCRCQRGLNPQSLRHEVQSSQRMLRTRGPRGGAGGRGLRIGGVWSSGEAGGLRTAKELALASVFAVLSPPQMPLLGSSASIVLGQSSRQPRGSHPGSPPGLSPVPTLTKPGRESLCPGDTPACPGSKLASSWWRLGRVGMAAFQGHLRSAGALVPDSRVTGEAPRPPSPSG